MMSDDLISRSELISKYLLERFDTEADMNRVEILINNAPTVESDKELYETIETYKNAYRILSDAFENEVRKNKRPQGKWIPNYTSQFINPGRQCSLCGKIVEFSENFCPNCGADMRGEENEQNKDM